MCQARTSSVPPGVLDACWTETKGCTEIRQGFIEGVDRRANSVIRTNLCTPAPCFVDKCGTRGYALRSTR